MAKEAKKKNAPAPKQKAAPQNNPYRPADTLTAEETPLAQMLLIAFWTACIIMLVRLKVYEAEMEQFFWSNYGDESQLDFFSYLKMQAILVCAILAVLILVYRYFTGSFTLKKTFVYIPMLVYSVMVLLSYAFSEYKTVALWGWNERFEGTLVLLAYMVMLFFIINSINSEWNARWVVYSVVACSVILGILGLTQVLDMDFFQTTVGKKLITPPEYWGSLDQLKFTFQNREIYQTVYNINYVSFYLALLIPIFFMMYLRDNLLKYRLLWGGLLILSLINLVGAKSAGGFMGLGVAFVIALVVCNKRLLDWKKPLAIALAVMVAGGALSFSYWWPEVGGAIKGVTRGPEAGPSATEVADAEPASVVPYIDYIITGDNQITMSLNEEPITFTMFRSEGAINTILIADGEDQGVEKTSLDDQGTYTIDDPRFYPYITLTNAEISDELYILVNTVTKTFPFQWTEDGFQYHNDLNYLLPLDKVPSIGWENNLRFGTNRGLIWSRTLPLMVDTLLLGYGADTYCIYYPHDDYAGNYNTWGGESINMIVDKPHNMYMGMAVGTGGISLLALLGLWGFYLVQSFRLYFRREYKGFLDYAGAGIFFGVCAFLVSGLVDDSSVSLMPMFYSILGTGIAINLMLKQQDAKSAASSAV